MLRYCDSVRREIIKTLPEWEDQSPWIELCTALREEFRAEDRYQTTHTMSFLNELVRVDRKGQDLKSYCRQYSTISKTLLDKRMLSDVDRGRMFLLGLPKWMREKLVVKYGVDDLKPDTYADFASFTSYVLKFNKSSMTNKALEMQKDPTPEYQQEIRELIEERTKAQKVADETRKVPPIVQMGSSIDRAQIDELSHEMARLRIQTMEFKERYAANMPLQMPGYDQPTNTVRLNPMHVSGSGWEKNSCLYCRGEIGPPGHWKRDCAWYNEDISKGVCHLDGYGKLCLGPPNAGTRSIQFMPNPSWAKQIRLKTAGTEFDKNGPPESQQPPIPPGASGQQQTYGYVYKNKPQDPTTIMQNPDRHSSQKGQDVLVSQAQQKTVNLKPISIGLSSVAAWENESEESSEDSESEPEIPSVKAATIDQRRSTRASKNVTFENATKVAKARMQKESRYATPSRENRQDTESGTLMETGENDNLQATVESEEDDEMDDVPSAAETRKSRRRVRKHRKYVDDYTSSNAKQGAFDNLMNQAITLKIKDLVALEGGLSKMLSKRMPLVPPEGRTDVVIRDGERVNAPVLMTMNEVSNLYDKKRKGSKPRGKTPKVGLIKHVETIQRHSPSLAMQTAKMRVLIGGRVEAPGTLDTGAEVNVMTKKMAEKAKLMILRDHKITFQTINGIEFVFYGLCKNVEVDIGGIINYGDFLIIEEGTLDVLLGMPFFFESEMTFDYPADGTMRAVFWNNDRTSSGTVLVAGDKINIGVERKSEN